MSLNEQLVLCEIFGWKKNMSSCACCTTGRANACYVEGTNPAGAISPGSCINVSVGSNLRCTGNHALVDTGHAGPCNPNDTVESRNRAAAAAAQAQAQVLYSSPLALAPQALVTQPLVTQYLVSQPQLQLPVIQPALQVADFGLYQTAPLFQYGLPGNGHGLSFLGF